MCCVNVDYTLLLVTVKLKANNVFNVRMNRINSLSNLLSHHTVVWGYLVYCVFCLFVVSDIAIFVLKRDVKLQLTN